MLLIDDIPIDRPLTVIHHAPFIAILAKLRLPNPQENQLRPFSHINPRYVKDRLREMYHERTKPDQPWLTNDANKILDTYLTKSDVGLEFGSGRSTVWLGKRIGRLTSIEHDQFWFNKVERMIDDANITNVQLQLASSASHDDSVWNSPYLKAVDNIRPDSLDFVLIDGIYRGYCALAVLDHIRTGGLLVVDDAHRYLPSNSHAPLSRSLEQGPQSENWEQFMQSVSSWRLIWTCSGISDTVMFFKPHEE